LPKSAAQGGEIWSRRSKGKAELNAKLKRGERGGGKYDAFKKADANSRVGCVGSVPNSPSCNGV
jgi:hypothetical protein